jgi:hypothetical protein
MYKNDTYGCINCEQPNYEDRLNVPPSNTLLAIQTLQCQSSLLITAHIKGRQMNKNHFDNESQKQVKNFKLKKTNK